jgi:predicted nuclease of predicted toxin-antitoxin system
VKLRFDENLSPSFVRRLADVFPVAREHDYVVVTKDADFRALRLMFGQSVSRVVWIRSGNGSTTAIEQALRSRVQALRAVAADNTGIVDIL